MDRHWNPGSKKSWRIARRMAKIIAQHTDDEHDCMYQENGVFCTGIAHTVVIFGERRSYLCDKHIDEFFQKAGIAKKNG